MSKIIYMTLADLRRENPVEFDNKIKTAVQQAAKDVGEVVVINALCSPSHLIEEKSLAA